MRKICIRITLFKEKPFSCPLKLPSLFPIKIKEQT